MTNFKLKLTEWRVIKDFPDYSVSKSGDVKRNNNIDVMGRKRRIGLLSPCYSTGYGVVILMKDGKTHYKKVHRLVAEAFLPNPNNYPDINHKDENKRNNNVENLEWCTEKYNNTYNNRAKKVGEKTRKYINIYEKDGKNYILIDTCKVSDIKRYNISSNALYKYLDSNIDYKNRKTKKIYKLVSAL